MRSSAHGPRGALRTGRLPLLGLAMAIGLVAGCTGGGDPAAAPADTGTTVPDARGRPAVGQCRVNGSHVVKDAHFDDQPTVACTAPHGLETWRVVELPDPYGPAATYPADDAAHDQLSDAASDSCGRQRGPHGGGEALEFLGVPFAEPAEGAVQQSVTPYHGYVFTPSPAQWDAGARWVRCDVGLLVDDPTGSLTGSLQGVHRTPPPGGIPPLCAAGDPWISCDAPHDVEVVSRYVDVAGQRPGSDDKAANDQWRSRCHRDTRAYLGLPIADPFEVSAYPVTWPERWATGTHVVECRMEYPDLSSKDRTARTISGSARLRGHLVPPTVAGA
jgi:hypothetical protein